jgi:hypothetical protein
MIERERRVVSDLNTSYLSAEAMADIERLGIELAEVVPLTVCDYDADQDGNPTWVVAEGVTREPTRQGRGAAGGPAAARTGNAH